MLENVKLWWSYTIFYPALAWPELIFLALWHIAFVR